MAIEVRVVPQDDLRRWVDTVETSFGDEMREERWEEFRRVLEQDRSIAAYDGEAMVGGAAAFSFRMTVPGGGQVDAAGVTAVGVLPTHRRQGILNQLMRHQLEDSLRRGEPAAILWASEGGIYQRYGYGLASLNATIDIERERALFRIPPGKLGRMRLVGREDAAAAFPPVYEAVRVRTPGFLERDPTWWEVHPLADGEHLRRGRSQKFYALHERDGVPRGYALYRIKPEWGDAGSRSVLQVQEVIATDALATREIWSYLFGVDLIERIQSWAGPPDDPLLLMLAEPRRLRLRLGDGLWLRILDVPAALEARSYLGDGEIVLQVDDPFLPAVGGSWKLSVAGGSARVESADAPPDVILDVTDLAAVYLGGFSFAQMAVAGRTQEVSAGARSVADRLFASHVRPWCPEIF